MDKRRFFSKVAKRRNGCWEWTAFRNPNGYGMFKDRSESRRMLLAHRYSWVLHQGRIPIGKHVLHHCDNPACVNPQHLFIGTNADNVADRHSKGRTSNASRNVGSAHGLAKLNEQKARDIKAAVASGVPQRQVAIKYGVCPQTVGNIVHRVGWKHI